MLDILSQLAIKKIRAVNTMYTPKTGNRVVRTNRPYWGIIIKYEGETIYKNHLGEYVSDASHLIILPKGASYEWTCTKSGHYIILDFESDEEYNNLISLTIPDNEDILKIFRDLEKLRVARKPLWKIESIYLIYALILKALKLHNSTLSRPAPFVKRERIAPAFNYIINNFTKPISNEELAYLCQISTVYFRKLFFEVYGTSPINYINNLRIKKAKEMLRSDYSSITDIALSLGYNNIYEFSKAFKKHTGVSPKQY